MIQFTSTQNAAQSAKLLAQNVAENLRQVLAKQEYATLSVSGGKSPIIFFQTLSQCELDWARVRITLVDERIVPTQHNDSNTRLVRQYLQQKCAAQAIWLPMIDDAANEDSLKDIPQAVAFAVQHFTQPDVLVLGMGSDGHTASLFPYAPQLDDALAADYPQPLLHTSPQTAPHERISMTLAAIERTAHIYLAIAGADKFIVYQQAAQARQKHHPISYILHSEKVTVHVFYHD